MTSRSMPIVRQLTSLALLAAPALLAGCSAPAPASQSPAPAQQSSGGGTGPASGFASRTAGMQRHDGFLPVHVGRGKAMLELPGDTTRALVFVSQATGLGSNPIGIDRGGNGPGYIARFERDGDRVLLVYENWSYRGDSANAAHGRSVAESFPPSTIASLPLVATEGGRLLVDVTDWITSDLNDVAGTLSGSGQGSYAIAKDRSSVNPAATRAFPGNTELDAKLTFAAGGRPGQIVQQIVPDGRAFTVRQHLSLLPLPGPGFRPREQDPRVGYFGITFRDYAQPLQASLVRRWAARHRLERVNPADPASPFRDTIVYYIDRGIPEPIRSATVAGAKFWEEAFDQAGLRGAFRAELLPEGADPMDARYNVVQWVNRHERGWSIGGAHEDPRTGELIKGMARMDSHRARTAYNLYAALFGADPSPNDTAFVLGRVRQVTAHEIGHTLGIAHNYIASTYERGSLMDYPPPRVRLAPDGSVTMAEAYDLGPGEYDVWTVRWGYGIFPPGAEDDSLAAIVREGLGKGFLYLSDADARPEYSADPRTNLWDDAASAAEFFGHQLAVRRAAMARFGLRNIREGEPLSLLQERFAPLYFFHRFAIGSIAKAIGGMEYANALRGDAQQASRPVAAAEQRNALSLLAQALRPEELAVPDTVVTLLAPRPGDNSVELFRSRARPAFDELGAARTLAQMVLDAALQRDRAARLVQQAMYADPRGRPLTLGEAMDTLERATWNRPAPRSPKLAALQRVTQRAYVDRLLSLAADSMAEPQVRALADLRLESLRAQAQRRGASGDVADRAHWRAIAGDLARWIERQELPQPTPALVAPPGDPFGEEP
jgi:hypothetical protein